MATFSKREQKIMDRLKASGHLSSCVALDPRFSLIIRPFTTVGVEKGNLASLFEEAISSTLERLKLESSITGIAIFPTIFDSTIAPVPRDYVKYKRGEKSVFVGLHIDFLSWNSASEQEKLSLLANNIRNSIERIPEKYLSRLDRKKLLDVTSRVHERLLDRLLH